MRVHVAFPFGEGPKLGGGDEGKPGGGEDPKVERPKTAQKSGRTASTGG